MICLNEPAYLVGMFAIICGVAVVLMLPVSYAVYRAIQPPTALTPEELELAATIQRNLPGYSPGVWGSLVAIARSWRWR